jgi:hypothetical protein
MKSVIDKAATVNGGWTREQLAGWGVPWPPPRGWKKRLEGKLESKQEFNDFAERIYRDNLSDSQVHDAPENGTSVR